MFAKALFPTDFSAYANTVFACLPDLKASGLQIVVLVSVIRTSSVPIPEPVENQDLKRIEWSVLEEMNIARMALEGQEFRVITRVEHGLPVECILRVAKEERVDLIAIGAQGKTLSQEMFLGSVAYEVMRHAAVPVLIQKAHVIREMGHPKCHPMCEQMFSRILYLTDFSECAEASFQLIKHFKSVGTHEVILLHVQDERVLKHRPAEQIAAFDHEDSERLDTLCRSLLMYGMQARSLIRHGHPVREALKVAEEENPSLIVLGSQGRGAIQEILTGSTLENVVRLCRQPVLVTRGPQQA